MTLKIEHFLILIIVWLYPTLSNSYDLIRIMNRYFGMFEIGENYDLLVNNEYLFKEEKNKIEHYKITSKGEKLIIDNIEIILFESRKKFIVHVEFLESVLESLMNKISNVVNDKGDSLSASSSTMRFK